MNKLKSFCKTNKPFAVVILAFILLGVVFSGKLLNSNHQEAQVLSAGSDTLIPYNQYPALSNSGFYLETAINSGNYYQALTGIRLIMTDTAIDIKSLISNYYSSSCVSVVSDTCSSKRTAILNSLYTYSTYSVSYYRLNYESTHGPLVNSTIDWAGMAVSSLNFTLNTPSTVNPNIDSILADISNINNRGVTGSISSGMFGPTGGIYKAPLRSDVDNALNKLLTVDSKYLSADTAAPHSAFFDKGQNLASIASVFNSAPATINTFTINGGTTGLTVDQGGSLTIAWNIANASGCYAMGGAGTSWTKNSKGVASAMLSVPASGILNTTMGSSVSQTFTLACGVPSGSTFKNITKSITVGVNPAKVVTQIIQATPTPVVITPAGTLSGTLTTSAPISTADTLTLVGPVNTSASPTITVLSPGTGAVYKPTILINSTPTNTLSGTVLPPPVANPPFVGPLPPTLYNNPYLFVFGANALGNLDFKILKKAFAGDASSKFGQVNGSVGEIDVTMVNLQNINKNVSTEVLSPSIDRVVTVMNSKVNNNKSSPAGAARFTLTTKNSGGVTVGTVVGGTLTTSDGINCGKTCSKIYDNGTYVKIIATYNVGSQQDSWNVVGASGECLTSNQYMCVVKMKSNVTVTSNWIKKICTPRDDTLLEKLGTALGNRVTGGETKANIMNQIARNPNMSAAQKDQWYKNVRASTCWYWTF
jgi:hypothetical protein